jgi:hypothetical protein
MTMVPTQTGQATQAAHKRAPISDADPYADETLIDPATCIGNCEFWDPQHGSRDTRCLP